MILRCNPKLVNKGSQFIHLGAVCRCFRCAYAHMKTIRDQLPDSSHRFRPGALPAISIVWSRLRPIQTDLDAQVGVGNAAELLQPLAAEQHRVRQDSRRKTPAGISQLFIDVVQYKRFATSEKKPFETKGLSFIYQPLNFLDTQSSPGSPGRRVR